LAALCVLAPVGAQAFSQCTVTPIGSGGAQIVEEAANPVVAGGVAYTGFVNGGTVTVLAATANGATLGAPVTVSQPDAGPGRHLRLAAIQDRVYTVWQEDVRGRLLNLRFTYSHDGAKTWSTPVVLGQSVNDIPQIAADASNVHVAFLQKDDNVSVINSTDSGRSFGTPVVLGKGAGEVVVASHGNHVYVAWETGSLTPTRDVMMAVSNDGGKTFSASDISNNGVRNAREPIMSLNQTTGRLSLVWREDNPVQGVYLQSKDNGQTWTAPMIVGFPARQVMVQDDNAYIYVTYLEVDVIGDQQDYQTLVTFSTDGGQTWSKAQNLTGPSGISKLNNDDDRPIPWALDGAIRITGIEADGVHIWSGKNGHLRDGVYLGPGILASPQGNSAAWQSPGGVVSYASCR
jgi:hypothetical protein